MKRVKTNCVKSGCVKSSIETYENEAMVDVIRDKAQQLLDAIDDFASTDPETAKLMNLYKLHVNVERWLTFNRKN